VSEGEVMRWWPVGVLAAVLVLAMPARGDEAIAYHTTVSGLEDTDLGQKVEADSLLVSHQDDPVAGLAVLQRRADDDHGRIEQLLRSEGYYRPSIDISVDPGQRPVAVAVRVDPGPVFRLKAFDIQSSAVPPCLENLGPLENLGVELGEPARAETVVAAEKKLLASLAEDGYPLARILDRDVVVDHADASMRVRLVVECVALAHFGAVTITGLKTVDETWLRNRIPWQDGDRFSVSVMERLRKRLADSRLFSSVKVSTAAVVAADGRLPVTIGVVESRHRSVGLGGNWSSTEGIGGNAFWEHRNLFDGGEHLRAQLTGSEIRNAFDLTYDGPDVGLPDQDLIAAAKIEELRTKAYVTRTQGASAGLSWLLTETLRASASGAFEHTRDVEQNQPRTFTLVSAPLDLRYDGSDDLLDPTKGQRVTVAVQPFLGLLGGEAAFNRFEANGSAYVKVTDEPRVVLAGWGRLGTIQGAETFDVPAPHRFFVGGAGSVRGFGLQKAGPVDAVGDPVGGLSALSFGGEIRIRASESIGVVPFIEGGRAYLDSVPQMDLPLFWGAGLGLRWFTPVGPVRADVAVPLNPRSGIDSPYQIYLSLGQAF
jgi:translocation and assembly module TamA